MTDPADKGTDGGDGSKTSAADLAAETARIMASQAAAFSVMAAYGMQMAGKMTGMMLEAMAKASEARPSSGSAPSTEQPAAKPESPATKAEPAKTGTAAKAPADTNVVKLKPKPATRTKAAAKVAPKRTETAGQAADKAGDPGDLKRISGIGPRLERALKEKGIVSLAAIAAWTDEDMKRIDAELGLENRIIRDDWARQAKALLEG